MSRQESGPSWWVVVKTLADLVIASGSQHLLGDGAVRLMLLSQGFAEQDISKAFEWLDQITYSGMLPECLAMIQPSSAHLRVSSPIEEAYISNRLWQNIQTCRLRGLFSDDLIEKMLEGVKAFDTRDWNDEEVMELLLEIMGLLMPGTTDRVCRDILEGRYPEFYS